MQYCTIIVYALSHTTKLNLYCFSCAYCPQVNHVELGVDINVTGVWEAGFTGKGVTVCVIDDGKAFS